MKPQENVWGWMLAADFFLAGMGGGILVVAALVDLFQGPGGVSLAAAVAAPVCIALGAALLVLELGRMFQGWRVFMNPKAILTIGAWSMTLAIGVGVLIATFYVPVVPWATWNVVRQILTVLSLIFGLIVATYPGVLLARHKSRPFWSGPGIVAIFLTSSLATGLGAHLLLGALLAPSNPAARGVLPLALAVVLGLQLVLWPVYLFVKRTGMTEREARAANRWIRGDLAVAFWVGLLAVGTIVPLALQLFPDMAWWAVGAVLAVLGGALMRWMVIRSGEQRTWLPGEEFYRSRLPKGDEAFLAAWVIAKAPAVAPRPEEENRELEPTGVLP